MAAHVVLIHLLAHARGTRVSAGAGAEYQVGPDGLLYSANQAKSPSGGAARYLVAPQPGVHPNHVEALLRSRNIERAPNYTGTVFSGSGPAAQPVAAQRVAVLEAELADARRQIAKLTASLAEAQASAAEPKPSAGKAPPPPPPPPTAADAAPTAADAAPTGAVDWAAVLDVSIGKLGTQLAEGAYDQDLSALRAAELAGKNRTGALAVIDARSSALAAD